MKNNPELERAIDDFFENVDSDFIIKRFLKDGAELAPIDLNDKDAVEKEKALEEFAKLFEENMEECLPEEAMKIMNDNLWDLV